MTVGRSWPLILVSPRCDSPPRLSRRPGTLAALTEIACPSYWMCGCRAWTAWNYNVSSPALTTGFLSFSSPRRRVTMSKDGRRRRGVRWLAQACQRTSTYQRNPGRIAARPSLLPGFDGNRARSIHSPLPRVRIANDPRNTLPETDHHTYFARLF